MALGFRSHEFEMTANDQERLYRLMPYIADLKRRALEEHISEEDLLLTFTMLSITTKIVAHASGTSVETIQEIEKAAIKTIVDLHISKCGIRAKNELKDLGLYEVNEK